jgi:hypothetical protein
LRRIDGLGFNILVRWITLKKIAVKRILHYPFSRGDSMKKYEKKMIDELITKIESSRGAFEDRKEIATVYNVWGGERRAKDRASEYLTTRAGFEKDDKETMQQMDELLEWNFKEVDVSTYGGKPGLFGTGRRLFVIESIFEEDMPPWYDIWMVFDKDGNMKHVFEYEL